MCRIVSVCSFSVGKKPLSRRSAWHAEAHSGSDAAFCLVVTLTCIGSCAQLELILTAATLCIAIVGVISGLFGMNLHNTHEDSYLTFVLVSSFPTHDLSRDAAQGYMVSFSIVTRGLRSGKVPASSAILPGSLC